MTAVGGTRTPRSMLEGLLLLGAAAFTVHQFGESSASYQGYLLPQGGTVSVPPLELVFFTWYTVYGLTFVALTTLALERFGFAVRLADGFTRAARWKGWLVVLPLLAGATSVAVRLTLVQRQAITDDEEVYRFIARTLLAGRVINPLPPEPQFFQNQFIVLNAQGWFGKYPIGHPLVLALGQSLRLEDFLLPAMGGVTAWLTHRLARALMGPRRAVLALVLVALSPHFTWTYATLLSQTTSCFALTLAVTLLAGRRPSSRARVGAGLALGLGLLARPAPGALFIPVAMLVCWKADKALPLVPRAMAQLGLLLPASLAGVALLAVNAAQVGAPLESGYQTVHGSLGWFWGGVAGQTGLSVFAALWRENFWLLGWPLSLLPVALARPSRGKLLLFGPLVAELAYRLAVPKTVVSTTGPVYVMEVVPILAVLAADGLARLRVLSSARWGKSVAAGRVSSAASASAVAALLMFLPVMAGTLARAGDVRQVLPKLLADNGIARAVIFCDTTVPRDSAATWAYYPPNPDPALTDPVIVLRWPRGAPPEVLAEFAARRFPDRPAYQFLPGTEPRLVPLKAGPTPN